MSTPTVDELLDLALAAAQDAGEVALGYFRRDLAVHQKSDETPVTVADREGERRLRARIKLERSWGDCYGHALVATGRAEIMLDPIMSEWDACPLLPILEEAGGRFSDWTGVRTVRGGNAISTNRLLFEAVIALVRESTG